MEYNGPIVFIDDDPDDQLFFKPLLEEIAPENDIIIFSDGQKAIEFLRTTDQALFLIISEVSLNGMNGLELRRQIEADPLLRKKSHSVCLLYPSGVPPSG